MLVCYGSVFHDIILPAIFGSNCAIVLKKQMVNQVVGREGSSALSLLVTVDLKPLAICSRKAIDSEDNQSHFLRN